MAFERSKKNTATKINIHKNVVNTPTPYETIIAAKLEQLPVPDMADSIWASIEMQLDAGLPGDGDNAPSNKPTTGKPGMGKGFYFSLLTAIVITIILINRTNKKQNNTNNTLPVIPKTEIVTPVADSNTHTIVPPGKNNITVPNNNADKKDTSTIPIFPGNRIIFDSAKPQPLIVNKTDSAALLKDKVAVPLLDSLAKPPLPKPNGIKGITPDDYKIKGDKKDPQKKGE